MEPKMFCFQCQETAGNKGCMFGGVCGKKPETANLQDLLIYVTKGLSEITTRLRSEGKEIPAAIDRLITTNLFMTITNANFDDDRFIDRINETLSSRDELFEQLHDDTGLSDAASWQYRTAEERTLKADKVGVLDTGNEDLRSLRELTLYGLKGMAAYNKHANVLGYADTAIDAFLQKALAKTLDDSLSTDDLTSLVLETGSFGVKVMALLDTANTSTYGNPEITKVELGVRNNPAILISGHDLRDLEMLLEQTANTGVDVYTHSEMLPAHYYPAFKKYPHFAGNYGNAWWKQKEEFEACQQYALDAYADNIVLLDTGSAKLMTPYYPLEELRMIPGFERARFEDPLSGGKGNSMRYFNFAHVDASLKADGKTNLFCGGERAGAMVGHTEAIVSGSLAGHNAARAANGLAPVILPETTAIGEFIGYVVKQMLDAETRNKKYTFSGSVYFERMQAKNLYSTDDDAIKARVEAAGCTNIFSNL